MQGAGFGMQDSASILDTGDVEGTLAATVKHLTEGLLRPGV